jgi:hypothetical protein
MDYEESTAIHSYSIVVCIHCRGNVFTKPLPSNVNGETHREEGDLISLIYLFKIRKVC